MAANRFSRREHGQAILELLLVLFILVPLLFGAIELSRGVSLRHSLASSTQVAVRALSLEPAEWTWASNVIQDSVTGNVLGGGNVSAVTISAYDDTGQSLTPAALAGLPFGTPFRVEASVDYTPDIPLFSNLQVTIRVTHWGIVERYP